MVVGCTNGMLPNLSVTLSPGNYYLKIMSTYRGGYPIYQVALINPYIQGYGSNASLTGVFKIKPKYTFWGDVTDAEQKYLSEQVDLAINEWNAGGTGIKFVKDKNSENTINFTPYSSNVEGETHLTQNTDDFKVLINYQEIINREGHRDAIKGVINHELGHVLRLRHYRSDDGKPITRQLSVMLDTYDGFNIVKYNYPQNYDISSVRGLY